MKSVYCVPSSSFPSEDLRKNRVTTTSCYRLPSLGNVQRESASRRKREGERARERESAFLISPWCMRGVIAAAVGSDAAERSVDLYSRITKMPAHGAGPWWFFGCPLGSHEERRVGPRLKARSRRRSGASGVPSGCPRTSLGGVSTAGKLLRRLDGRASTSPPSRSRGRRTRRALSIRRPRRCRSRARRWTPRCPTEVTPLAPAPA